LEGAIDYSGQETEMNKKELIILAVLIIIACFFLAAIFTGEEHVPARLLVKGILGVGVAISLLIYTFIRTRKK